MSWNAIYEYKTVLIDQNVANAWNNDELIGKYVQPNVTDSKLYFIVDNGLDWVAIWGNVSDEVTAGNTYQIYTLDLASTSGCRDAGDNASAPDDDFEGEPRAKTTGDAADIGAYEY